MQTEPLSCWPLQTRYGNELSVRDVIERRRRLVVPAAPRLAAVERDDRALIRRHRDDVGIVRIEPGALVVVAAGRAANRRERAAAVGGLPRDDGRHDHDVGIGRVHADIGRVARPRQHARIAVDARPRLAGVIRSKHAGVARFDDREQARRPARRDADADAAQAIGSPSRQARGQLPPGRAAIGGLEQAAAGSAEIAVLPRPLPRLPQRGIDDVRSSRDRSGRRRRRCSRPCRARARTTCRRRSIGRCRARCSVRTDVRAPRRTPDWHSSDRSTTCADLL